MVMYGSSQHHRRMTKGIYKAYIGTIWKCIAYNHADGQAEIPSERQYLIHQLQDHLTTAMSSSQAASVLETTVQMRVIPRLTMSPSTQPCLLDLVLQLCFPVHHRSNVSLLRLLKSSSRAWPVYPVKAHRQWV